MMDSFCDEAIVATNDEATICKYQTALKGYYYDPFIEKLLPAKMKNSMSRKAPEIHRGYWARVHAISLIVEEFISHHPSGCQVISLGAGYDTLFWKLTDMKVIEYGDVNYVEIDMSSVVVKKLMAIKRQADLREYLTSLRYQGEGLHSNNYHLISFDLRQVDKVPLKIKLFEDCKLSPNKPTLCLAECVLVYMPLHDSSSLISWLSENFEDLSLCNYEQCNIDDRFGEIMISNMNARHCRLMGVEACKSIETQIDRLKSNGLPHTQAWTMLNIYNINLSPIPEWRIEDIEHLDERELLEQLLEHYCIVIGSHRDINWLPQNKGWQSDTCVDETLYKSSKISGHKRWTKS